MNSKAGQPRKRQPFEGDPKYRLPAGMKEHYRLWFEFLKLAHRDSSLKIDKKHYADWGDVASADFDKWWEANWRTLFGVPLDVIEIDPLNPDSFATLRHGRLTISIDPTAGLERTLQEVKALIRARTAGMPRKKAGLKHQGRFFLSEGAEVKRKYMQQALKVYELALAHGDDRVKVAEAYLEWANSWNNKLRKGQWKREPILVPPYLDAFLKQQRGEAVVAGTSKGGNSPDSNRRKVARLIGRAKAIAANVAGGKFPGNSPQAAEPH